MGRAAATDPRLMPRAATPPPGIRRRGRRAIAGALLSAGLAGCGASAPTVAVLEPLPAEEPVLVVTAARQKQAVERALRAAGFTVDERPRADAYLLRVTLGIDQGSRPCGTLNNVRYALRREKRTLVEIEAKGWTGTCEPNVFDAASQALRQQFGAPAEEVNR